MSSYRIAYALLYAWFVVCASGCFATRVKWRDPKPYALPILPILRSENPVEQMYRRAIALERSGSDACVDAFFEVAIATADYSCRSTCDCSSCDLHKSALAKLVSCGQRFGRLKPSRGLVVKRNEQTQLIPFRHNGFVWRAEDFHCMTPVGEYKSKAFRCTYQRDGVGIPLVVTRVQNPERGLENFLPNRAVFAATLCLGTDAGENTEGCEQGYYFKVLDPLRVDHVATPQGLRPIAKDTSAPLAFRLRDERSTILDQFINPGAAGSESHLYTLEPYQRGKIPVVLIHGLLSDPFTWVEMVNALQSNPEFVRHYQIWVFEYPTGRAFLASAADLRQELEMARNQFDSDHTDVAMSKMVLVGHSMGGLIAKLQITDSQCRLWDSVAKKPFDQVRMPDRFREELTRSFFYRASQDVSRVIYIGTPHRGSVYARRLVGRIGAALVSPEWSNQQAYKQMLDANPGVFSDELSGGIPSSIDLLEPKSELLNAIDRLPLGVNRSGASAQLHSIIGDSRQTLFFGRSDGVVPVSSARDFRSQSERVVDSKHGDLNKDSETIEEVQQLLIRHVNECHQ